MCVKSEKIECDRKVSITLVKSFSCILRKAWNSHQKHVQVFLTRQNRVISRLPFAACLLSRKHPSMFYWLLVFRRVVHGVWDRGECNGTLANAFPAYVRLSCLLNRKLSQCFIKLFVAFLFRQWMIARTMSFGITKSAISPLWKLFRRTSWSAE